MPLPRPAPGTGRWWVVGVVGVTVATALAVWLGLANSVGRVTWVDTGYKVLDDRSVRVEFDVHRPAGQAVTCQVNALDQSFGVVGTLDVRVPASGERSVHQEVVVRTAARAVTGTVRTCDPS
ncbi:hypothetical protein GCM10027517_36650 [Phycicoccus ginsengisoli]